MLLCICGDWGFIPLTYTGRDCGFVPLTQCCCVYVGIVVLSRSLIPVRIVVSSRLPRVDNFKWGLWLHPAHLRLVRIVVPSRLPSVDNFKWGLWSHPAHLHLVRIVVPSRLPSVVVSMWGLWFHPAHLYPVRIVVRPAYLVLLCYVGIVVLSRLRHDNAEYGIEWGLRFVPLTRLTELIISHEDCVTETLIAETISK